MRAVRLVLLAALAASSCGGNLRHVDAGLEYVREMVRKMDCRDGSPAKILVDPHCVDGICGVTCAPDRWQLPPGK